MSSLTLPLRCRWNVLLFQGGDEALRWRGMSEVYRQVASLSGQCRGHDEKLGELAASLQKLQARVDQMDGAGMSSWAPDVAGPHVKDGSADGRLGSQVTLTSGRVSVPSEDTAGPALCWEVAVAPHCQQRHTLWAVRLPGARRGPGAAVPWTPHGQSSCHVWGWVPLGRG